MKRRIFTVIFGCIFVIGISGSVCLAKAIKLEIPSGDKIECIYYASTDKRPAVLILPGLSGLRTSWERKYSSFAKWLNKKYKFNALVIDYRAKSSKEIMQVIRKRKTTIFVKGEIGTALRYLQNQKTVNKEKIGLIGFSFGTVLGIMSAAEFNSVKALVLVSIILPPENKWRAPDPVLKRALAKYATKPVFFLADKQDDIQNRSNAAKNALYWSKKVKNAKIMMTNGGFHSVEMLQARGVKKMIGSWLQEKLAEK